MRQRHPLCIERIPDTTRSVSYYDFVVTMMQSIGSPVKIVPSRDSDFSFQGLKPLKTSMASELLPAMRSWQDALEDFLSTEGDR